MEFMIEFLKSFGLLAVIIVGLTWFKISTCKPFKKDGEEFDWSTFLWGTIEKVITAVVVSGVYVGAHYLGGDEVLFQIGEATFTFIQLMALVLSIALIYYGKKFITNFADKLGVSDKLPEIKETSPIDVIGEEE